MAFRSRHSLGLSEVAEHTGLLKRDVHRILKSLQQFGFIEQDGERGRYRLGLELLKLGHLVHHRLHLSEVARPFMRRLSETVEGVANLAVLDLFDKEVVFIEQIDSPSEGQIGWRIGNPIDVPHATAVGKVLLAHLDPETVRLVIAKNGLKRRTRHTITNAADLEHELRSVRECGFAADREEAVEGASCVGAPVRDYTRRVVAAVSVSMAADRLASIGEKRVASSVMSTADKISAVLGEVAPPFQPSDNVARGRSRVTSRPAKDSQKRLSAVG